MEAAMSQPSPEPIVPGQQIYKYKVLEFLGGGMAQVYKAQDVRHEREVALKVLAPDANTDPVARSCFLLEAKIGIKLRHDHIVHAYDVGEYHGRLFLIQEFLRGQELNAALTLNLVSAMDSKLMVMEHLADALHYIHGQGVIHRDIKPHNLFLQSHGSVKLTDFGAAMFRGEDPVPEGCAIGTAFYMSPEQVRCEPLTPATDIYSFGVCLYELFAGQRPFWAASETDLWHRILNDPVDSAALIENNVPRQLIELILQCLSKPPQDRPRNAQEILNTLKTIRSQKPSPANVIIAPRRATLNQQDDSLPFNLPTALIDQIVRGNCVAFVGAGPSVGAGFPDWRSLLLSMHQYAVEEGVDLPDPAIINDCIATGDLLLAADELRDRIGADRFRRFINSVFRKPAVSPTALHLELVRMPFAAVITTNYDTLLEAAYTILQKHTPLTFCHNAYPELAAALRSGEYYILKLHGSVDDIDSIILGRSDYRHIMMEAPALYAYLTSLFSTKTVLFIGYSLTDPDLLLLIDTLRSAYKEFSPRCYAIISNTSVVSLRARRLPADYGIDLITYNASFGHHDLLLLCQELHQRVREHAIPTAVQRTTTDVSQLAAEVRDWLETIRYTVTPAAHVSIQRTQMTATLSQGALQQSISVFCVEGELSLDDVRAARSAITLAIPQAWLISDTRISPRAAAEASLDSFCRLFTFSDFLRQVIWGPYIDALTAIVHESRLEQFYIDLACHKLDVSDSGIILGRDDFASLDEYVDRWLIERGKVHISLLGNFGAGKTWFCRHYSYRMLNRYLANPSRERLPLLITLRSFTKSMNVRQLINDAFIEEFRLPFVVGSAYEIFQAMNRRGKILLILDGFDEMASQTDYRTVVENFWELAKLVTGNSKIILTSRTEYFRWAKESERLFAGEESNTTNIVLEEARFEVIYINPLDEQRIEQLVIRRLGDENGSTVAKRLLAEPRLQEMLAKPVLVELLLSVMDKVSLDTLKNPAHIYLHATHHLMIRNITQHNTFTSTKDKLKFLCELAWEMIITGTLRIHYSEIPERIRTIFAPMIQSSHDLDLWDFDLRAQTLLHRDAAGYYEFAHKSLAEYFVALKLGAEVGCLGDVFRTTYRKSDFTISGLPYDPLPVDSLRDTFGKLPLDSQTMAAVCELLVGMIDGNSVKGVWNVITSTRTTSPARLGHVAANAIQLLRMRGESFRGRDCSGAVLVGAELPRDLRSINLVQADLTACDLGYADLRDADLTGCTLGPGSLRGADLRGTKGASEELWQTISRIPPVRSGTDRGSVLDGILELAERASGLMVVGPAGSGKSLTTAVLAHELAAYGYKVYVFSKSVATGADVSSESQSVQMQLYRELATFAILCGRDGPMSVVQEAKQDTPITELWTALAEALDQEKIVICIDDVERCECVSFIRFLIDRKSAAKIIITGERVPPGLEGLSEIKQCHPNLVHAEGDFTRYFGKSVASATDGSDISKSVASSSGRSAEVPPMHLMGEFTRQFMRPANASVNSLLSRTAPSASFTGIFGAEPLDASQIRESRYDPSVEANSVGIATRIFRPGNVPRN